MYLNVVLLYLIIIYSYQKSLSYDFKILPQKANFDSNAFLQYISITDFTLGTGQKPQKVQFNPGTDLTFILDKDSSETPLPYVSYNCKLSITYNILSNSWYTFANDKIFTGQHSLDQLIFGPITINQLHFFVADDWNTNQHYATIGLIGDYQPNSYHTFLHLLVDYSYIDKQQFSIQFYNKTMGRIIFGDDSEDSKDYTNLFNISTTKIIYPHMFFSLGNKVYIDNQNEKTQLDEEIDVMLDESFGFIQIPLKFKKMILQYYLQKMNCEEEDADIKWHSFVQKSFGMFLCNRNDYEKHAESLGNFVFQFNNNHLILHKNDLFRDYDNQRVIFSILIKKDTTNPQWVIGYPILKDYKVTHDYDSKTISFYIKADQTQNPKEVSNSVKLVMLLLWIVLILGITIDIITCLFQPKQQLINE